MWSMRQPATSWDCRPTGENGDDGTVGDHITWSNMVLLGNRDMFIGGHVNTISCFNFILYVFCLKWWLQLPPLQARHTHCPVYSDPWPIYSRGEAMLPHLCEPLCRRGRTPGDGSAHIASLMQCDIMRLKHALTGITSLFCDPGVDWGSQGFAGAVQKPHGSRLFVRWPDLHRPLQPEPPGEHLQDCFQGAYRTHLLQGQRCVFCVSGSCYLDGLCDSVFSRFFRRRLVCPSWWKSSVLKVTTSMQSSTIWHLCCPTWRSFLRPGTSWWTRTGAFAQHGEGTTFFQFLLSLLLFFINHLCLFQWFQRYIVKSIIQDNDWTWKSILPDIHLHVLQVCHPEVVALHSVPSISCKKGWNHRHLAELLLWPQWDSFFFHCIPAVPTIKLGILNKVLKKGRSKFQ